MRPGNIVHSRNIAMRRSMRVSSPPTSLGPRVCWHARVGTRLKRHRRQPEKTRPQRPTFAALGTTTSICGRKNIRTQIGVASINKLRSKIADYYETSWACRRHNMRWRHRPAIKDNNHEWSVLYAQERDNFREMGQGTLEWERRPKYLLNTCSKAKRIPNKPDW